MNCYECVVTFNKKLSVYLTHILWDITFCTESLALLPFRLSMCTFLDPVYMWELTNTHCFPHTPNIRISLNPTYNNKNITYKLCLLDCVERRSGIYCL